MGHFSPLLSISLSFSPKSSCSFSPSFRLLFLFCLSLCLLRIFSRRLTPSSLLPPLPRHSLQNFLSSSSFLLPPLHLSPFHLSPFSSSSSSLSPLLLSFFTFLLRLLSLLFTPFFTALSLFISSRKMSSLEAVRADGYYYDPDYDPKKHKSLNAFHHSHPLGDRAKKISEGILIIRFEIPFKVICLKCDHIIDKGVRFNAEKKCVGFYFTTKILEFSFSCPQCKNSLAITTDPKACRYVCTKGLREKIESFDVRDAETIELLDEEEREQIRLDPMKNLEYQRERRSLQQPRALSPFTTGGDGEKNSLGLLSSFSRERERGIEGEGDKREEGRKRRGGGEEEENEDMCKALDDLIDLQNSRHADDYAANLALRERFLLRKEKEEKEEQRRRGDEDQERKEERHGDDLLQSILFQAEEKKRKDAVKRNLFLSKMIEGGRKREREDIGNKKANLGAGEENDPREDMSKEELEDLVISHGVKFKQRKTALERLVRNAIKKRSSSIFHKGNTARKIKKRHISHPTR
ncbi:nuclear family protein [Cystoisospora suis]|uniref:Nuclear family protein n=1 Tax=Cystoisospora suis TaxID=483139 RepID=A0A2C6KQR0_9APIC|nr:nuclear family protein [Cystoisospora suis]